MRNAMLALAAVSLCGCAVSVKSVYGPDGGEAQAITCSSGWGLDWSDCFEKAGEICGTRGYKVWNQASTQSGVISGGEGGVIGTTSEAGTLLIACK